MVSPFSLLLVFHLECFKRYFNNDNHGTKDGAPSEVEPISRFPCCHVPGILRWDLPPNSFLVSFLKIEFHDAVRYGFGYHLVFRSLLRLLKNFA